jgi:hypothetical protein
MEVTGGPVIRNGGEHTVPFVLSLGSGKRALRVQTESA